MHRILDASSVPLAALAGLALFLLLFDPAILSPGNFLWVMQGDWGSNFLAWHAFRREEWHWPPGLIESLNAPDGTSIVYTDALPLLTMPLKALSPLLPDPLQYQGLWFALCWMLYGGFAALLLRRLGLAPEHAVLGAGLFLLLPAFWHRIGHDSLMAFWLLPAALTLYFGRFGKISAIAFAALLLAAAAINAYWLILLLPLWILWLAVDGTERLRLRLIAALGSVMALALWMALLGYFGTGADAAGQGAGLYSMNLNAPLNPQDEHWARLLPPLPLATEGQYEGFHYLGLGILLLLLTALVPVLGGGTARPGLTRRWQLLWLPLLGGTLYALSGTVTLNDRVVVDYPLPFIDIVRSSGRLFWLPAMIALTAAITVLCRRLPRDRAGLLLLGCLALQFWDIAPGLRFVADQARPVDNGRLQDPAALDPRWEDVIAAAHRLDVVPVRSPAFEELYAVTYKAISAGLETNATRMARFDVDAMTAKRAAQDRALGNGRLPPNSLLVFGDAEVRCDLHPAARARMRSLDGRLLIPPQSYNGPDLPRPDPLPWAIVTEPGRADLAELVNQCNSECTLLLAVEDEASAHLPDAFVGAMARRGATELPQLGFRDSYAAILVDGSIAAETLADDGPARARIMGFAAESAGQPHGNFARFRLGEELVCDGLGRGFTIMRVDAASREARLFHADTFLP